MTGDLEWCKLKRWPQMVQYGNVWLYADIFNIERQIITYLVWKEFGEDERAVTVFLELSYGKPVTVDPVTKMGNNGHPMRTHEYGGFDKKYFRLSTGGLWVAPSYRFSELNRKCFPRFYQITGREEKDLMEQYAHKRLDYIDTRDDHGGKDGHEHNEGWRGGREIDWDYIYSLQSRSKK